LQECRFLVFHALLERLELRGWVRMVRLPKVCRMLSRFLAAMTRASSGAATRSSWYVSAVVPSGRGQCSCQLCGRRCSTVSCPSNDSCSCLVVRYVWLSRRKMCTSFGLLSAAYAWVVIHALPNCASVGHAVESPVSDRRWLRRFAGLVPSLRSARVMVRNTRL